MPQAPSHLSTERLISTRVCHVQMAYYGNPQQRAFREYTQHLAKAGHEVAVIAAGRRGDPVHEYDAAGVEIFRIPVRSISKRSPEPIMFAIRAIQVLSHIKYRVDVVHCYTSWEMALVGLYCRTAGLSSCYDIRSGAISGGMWYRIGAILQKTIARLFDTTIVISEALGEQLFENYEYEVVPIGTDLSAFTPVDRDLRHQMRRDLGIGLSSRLGVYCGLMRNSKGAKTVTDIAMRVCAQDEEAEFLIVGGGEDLRENVERISACATASRIHFTGQVEPDQVPKHIGIADVALSYVPDIPLYAPQPPLKTAEYLACEVPVIGTDTPGQQIFIRSGWNGILVEDNEKLIAEAMVNLLKDVRQQDKLKSNSRSSVQHFDWEYIIVNHLTNVYSRILE